MYCLRIAASLVGGRSETDAKALADKERQISDLTKTVKSLVNSSFGTCLVTVLTRILLNYFIGVSVGQFHFFFVSHRKPDLFLSRCNSFTILMLLKR